MSARIVSVLLGIAKLLLVTSSSLAQSLSIEINNTPTADDDYICWTPVEGRAKLSTLSANPLTVSISALNELAGEGDVAFQEATGKRPTPDKFHPSRNITVTLKANGEWTSFWIAGTKASSKSKDVFIIARSLDGAELGRIPVMVRVRKDAESLTPDEIHNFLVALAKVHDVANGSLASKFAKHARAHGEAFPLGIHQSYAGFPLFLAWHRAFLLNLERELQTVDPSVTLPYWRFDRPAPKLFSADFMGAVPEGPSSGGDFLVQFSPSNPLAGWNMADDRGALVRSKNGLASGPVDADQLNEILSNSDVDSYQALAGEIELGYHNDAHRLIGGWLASGTSPRDPLFFLLHANVDRAWAHWQASQAKGFDPDAVDPSSYSAAGTYPGQSVTPRFREGSYAKDLLWPWSGHGGSHSSNDPLAVWPNFAWLMPPATGPAGMVLPPTPASQIDYLDTAGRGLAHGVCYDDIGYRGVAPPPSEGGPQ